MSKPLANKIALSLNESLADSDAFETVTLRPNEAVSAMISALNELLRQPVSTLFIDEISQQLSDLILGSKENVSLVEGFLNAPPAPGSAIALLARRGVIREVYDGAGLTFE